MLTNLDRYKKDLESLQARGNKLHLAMQFECFPEKFKLAMKKEYGEKAIDMIKTLPSFNEDY